MTFGLSRNRSIYVKKPAVDIFRQLLKTFGQLFLLKHLVTLFRIVVNESLRMPEDVAVDSLTRNLYFTDSGFRVIRVCSVDGRTCKNLITKDVDQPRGLALYPAEGVEHFLHRDRTYT